ncbi:MAG: hypothetical protein WA991_13220 [Ornithinimicrobium sp.]
MSALTYRVTGPDVTAGCDCVGAEEALLEDDRLLEDELLLEDEELLGLELLLEDELPELEEPLEPEEPLELEEPLEPDTLLEVAPPLDRVKPACTEQVGQAPGPWPASVRWATAICPDLLARSAREA